MHKIQTINNLAAKGLACFPADKYQVGPDLLSVDAFAEAIECNMFAPTLLSYVAAVVEDERTSALSDAEIRACKRAAVKVTLLRGSADYDMVTTARDIVAAATAEDVAA